MSIRLSPGRSLPDMSSVDVASFSILVLTACTVKQRNDYFILKKVSIWIRFDRKVFSTNNCHLCGAFTADEDKPLSAHPVLPRLLLLIRPT